MANLGGVTFVHMVNYFTKGIDDQGPFYEVEYYIQDWADSDDFVNELRGVGTLSPHRYPLSTNLICKSAVATGLGRRITNSEGIPSYAGGAMIKAVYRSPAVTDGGGGTDLAYDDPFGQHQIDPDTPIVWCTQELDYQIQTLTIPKHSYVWESDFAPAEVPFQMDVNITIMSLTFHRRSFLPVGQNRQKRGRINSSRFLGADPECVLFDGCRTQRSASTDGKMEQRIQLVFRERDESWNKFFRADNMEWDYLKDTVNARRRYRTTDLRPLVDI